MEILILILWFITCLFGMEGISGNILLDLSFNALLILTGVNVAYELGKKSNKK